MNHELEIIKDAITVIEGKTMLVNYLDHNKFDMPGDDHTGARYVNPQVRVWDGEVACEGDVVAEAFLSEFQPGLIVSAWAANALANTRLTDSIGVWAAQHGCEWPAGGPR